MHAARSRRLRPADDAEVVERGAHHLSDSANLGPVDARHGIQIDAQFVGMIEIVGADGMGMQFQARQIRHPAERRGVARDDFFRGTA